MELGQGGPRTAMAGITLNACTSVGQLRSASVGVNACRGLLGRPGLGTGQSLESATEPRTGDVDAQPSGNNAGALRVRLYVRLCLIGIDALALLTGDGTAS